MTRVTRFLAIGLLVAAPLAWGQKVWSPFGTEFLKQQTALLYDWTAENSDTNRRFRLNIGGDAYTGGFEGFATFSENMPWGRLTLNVLDTPVDWSPWLLSRPTRPRAYPDAVKPSSYTGLLAEVTGSNLDVGFYYAGQAQDSYSWGDGVSSIGNSLLGARVGARLGPLKFEAVGVQHWHRDLTTNQGQSDLLSPDLFSVNEQFYFEGVGANPGFVVEGLWVEGEAGIERADLSAGVLPQGLAWNTAPVVSGARWIFPGDAVLVVSNREAPRRLRRLWVTVSGNLQIRRKRQNNLSTDKTGFRPVAWSQTRGPDAPGFAASELSPGLTSAGFRRTLAFDLGHGGNAGLGLKAEWQGRQIQARIDWALQQKTVAAGDALKQALSMDAKFRLGPLLWGVEGWGHEAGWSGSVDGDPAVELSPSAGVLSAYRVSDPFDMLRSASGLSPGFFWYYENPLSHFLALGNDLDLNGAEDDREVGLSTGRIDPGGAASGGARFTVAGNLRPDLAFRGLGQFLYREGNYIPLFQAQVQWERVWNPMWQARAGLVEAASPSASRLPSPSLYQVDLLAPAGLLNTVQGRGEVQMDISNFRARFEVSAAWRQFESGKGRVEATPIFTVERPIPLAKEFTLTPRGKLLLHFIRGGVASSDPSTNLYNYDRAVLADMSESFVILNLEGKWRQGPLVWLNGLEGAFYDQQPLGESGTPQGTALPNPTTRLAAISRFEYRGNYLGRPVGLSFQIQGGLWSDTRPKYLPPLDQWKKFSAVEMRLYTGF